MHIERTTHLFCELNAKKSISLLKKPIMHLLFSLLIISFILSFKKRFDLNYSHSPILVISLIITVLYFNALYASLNIGYFIVLLLGIYSIFDNIYLISKNKLKLFQNEEKILISFLIFCFLISIASLFVKFSIWDEFTHWAPQAKYLYLKNSLRDEFIEFGAKSYPVGSALFYFPFLRYSTFNEGVVYFAHSLLLLLPLACFIDEKERLWQKTILKVFILIIFLTVFGVRLGPIGSIYMDQVVAIFFGSILVYYINSKKTFKEIILISFILISFLQFKDSLSAFAFLVIGFIIVDQGILFYQRKNNFTLKQFLILLSVLSALSVLSLKSWDYHLNSVNIQGTWNINRNIFDIISITLFPSEEYNRIILNNFINKLFEPYIIPNQVSDNLLKYFPPIKYILNLSPIQFLINQFILIFFIFILNKKFSKVILLHNSILFSGYLFYLYGLLILYNFSFGDYEGPRLASFERYQSIFQIGWILFNLNYVFKSKFFQNLNFNNIFLNFSWIPIFTFIVLASIIKIYIDNYTDRGQYTNRELHNRIQFFTNKVENLTESNSRIKVVWQKSNGLEMGIIRYDLLPRFIAGGSFGKKYNTEDIYTSNISEFDFFNSLRDFDYLLLAFTDKNFWELYRNIFNEINLESDFLIEYNLCHDKFAGFHSLSLGCHESTERVYLFKIINKESNLSLFAIN